MKADIKSSGIAAPVAQSRHPGELGASLATMASFSDELKNGANNFMLMLERVREISEATVTQYGDHIDGRDYKAMSLAIESAISANLQGDSKDVREGFLRALTDFLSFYEDGIGLPECWTPLDNTASSFACEGATA